MKMNQVNESTVKNVVSQWNVGGFFLEANWRTCALAAQEIKSQQRNKAEQLDKSGLDEKKNKANKLVDGFMLNHAWWNKTGLPKQQVSSLFSPLPPPPPPPTPLPRKKTQLTVGDLNVLQSSQIIFKRSERRFLSYLRKRLIHFSRALAFFPPGCLWIIRSTHPILLCKVHPLVPPPLPLSSPRSQQQMLSFTGFFAVGIHNDTLWLSLPSLVSCLVFRHFSFFFFPLGPKSLTSGPIMEKMP